MKNKETLIGGGLVVSTIALTIYSWYLNKRINNLQSEVEDVLKDSKSKNEDLTNKILSDIEELTKSSN
jgi:hypothetical protein